MYDKDKYPNYLSGTGYVMSIDTVAKLYNASLETPVFHLEDVFLTGSVWFLSKTTIVQSLPK